MYITKAVEVRVKVNSNLHISERVQYLQIVSFPDIPVAIVCKKKKTRGLYHVCERRY